MNKVKFCRVQINKLNSGVDFPGGTVVKQYACQCRRLKRHGFNPWVGNILWRRDWQPISVFMPEKVHGQRSLEGYRPWATDHN